MMVSSSRSFLRNVRFYLVLCACAATFSHAADMSVVDRWMATNSGIHSIRIDFTQTRTMRSIKMPIRQSGSLWLNYGSNQFRWQVGDPAQTIVTKFRGNLFIIRTQMKKYEKRAAGSGDVPPGLMAMATGFPRSTSEFQRKYSVQTIEVVGSAFRIVTQPKGQEGRGVKTFIFMVGRDDYRLRGMEIYLDDGSFVKTAFDRVIPNIGLPGDLFTPDLTGYKETKF